MKDLYNNLDIESILDPVALSSTGDEDGIDLAGANSAVLLFSLGDGTVSSTNKLTIKLEHADDDGTGSAGSYSEVEAKDVLGADSVSDGVILSIEDDEQVYKRGYVGGKRFLKVSWTAVSSFDCPTGIALIKGHLLDVPPIS